ncbi:hypothetical protein HKBW3S03_01293 [Candidatus Hakubella thermalkaliphila]|uniref:Uncharacterized protein n=2 Tax=Candidatus Hakubella thermalkaliphila TaxID=2754717 RepID=A0A6V8NHK7_9ACTN|nr:hypothetical protein [Candidatus Hakubella thermalkaliphila]MBT9170896.1 hypothetical protein [Actinomycetota bacterium]GFP19789.1 hypothetical protein HKBW3S03_01293 [Candidatus Hakubella thermalkaliphila]GFP27823.1 hypothetical protein HKBW3S33_01233 [Candidatus Hakubella thermalkaliphila]GFP30274.1 hypothetical protein HKBW3S34_01195 [Candidatus Hakubella thermalkaliphila]GFP36771.1 hypothetical protein HKBW3S44_00452 [Candidatus Hakubella thermalkaliphila]
MDYGNSISYSRVYLVSLLVFFLAVMALAIFAIASSWQNLFLERDDIAYIDLQEQVFEIEGDSLVSRKSLNLELER